MKRIFFPLACLACVALVVTSCRSSKEVASLDSINGEWNIVEINGSAVIPPLGKEFPSIGFDVTTGKIYGNSGCNRIMGSFDNTAKPGALDLGNIASTRMMCPDMTLEQNVLNAFRNVKGYRKVSNNGIALTNAFNRPVMVLSSKINLSVIGSLEGEWKIAEVKGEMIPDNLEKKPFLSFDTAKKSIHGNAGCNMINGGYTTDDTNERSISFPAIAATMMACPDMTTERKVMDSLNEVRTFNVLTDKSIGLYDQSGTMVLLLTK